MSQGGRFHGQALRKSQRRRAARPTFQAALPLFRAGDRVRWGERGPGHQGVVERVLPDETVDVIEDSTRRTWRLPIGKLARR